MEGLGAVRLVARVALGPPGTEVRVAQREFPDQFRQARLALAVGRRADVSDAYSGDGGPVHVASADGRVEEEHAQEVALALRDCGEVGEDNPFPTIPNGRQLTAQAPSAL
jgi:hypothetical protein